MCFVVIGNDVRMHTGFSKWATVSLEISKGMLPPVQGNELLTDTSKCRDMEMLNRLRLTVRRI